MEINPELVPEPIHLPPPIRIYSEADITDLFRITAAELVGMAKDGYRVWVCGGEKYYRAEDLMAFQVGRFNRMVSPGDSSVG